MLGYEQLCGPVGENGYGTGWPQLGQNAAGQNLYVVDALAAIRDMVQKVPHTAPPGGVAAAAADLDYLKLEYEQLAGPDGHGWPQLGNQSVTDCVAEIKRVLEGGGGATPPFPRTPGRGEGSPASGTPF